MAIIRKLSWLLSLCFMAYAAQAQISPCGTGGTAWNTSASGTCSLGPNFPQTPAWFSFPWNRSTVSAALDGSGNMIIAPTGAGHEGWGNFSSNPELPNIQAFTANFTFVPNGFNIAFVISNEYPNNGHMPSGAGGEGGFAQAANGFAGSPHYTFAMQLDSYNQPTDASTFGVLVYNTVQIYQTLQWPSLPINTQSQYNPVYATDKLSTAPVPLNLYCNTTTCNLSGNTSAGAALTDVFSATVAYDHGTGIFSFCMYDVTAVNGSCSSATSGTGTYYQHSWTGVWIPEIVGSSTAMVGFTAGTSGGTGTTPTNNLTINSFTYTINTPTTTAPTLAAWNANTALTVGTISSGTVVTSASPVFSVAPGSHVGTQTVSISTSTTPYNYVCYEVVAGNGTTAPTFYPWPDSNGGCTEGTLYSGPVTISSTSTLYASAGPTSSSFANGLHSPTGLGPVSPITAATYTITTGSAATPTFSPGTGSYTGTQSVAITTSSGTVICYNTTGSPATNGSTGCTTGTLYSGAVSVPSSETLYAVAGGTGYADSTVASAVYTIGPTALRTTMGGQQTEGGNFTEQ